MGWTSISSNARFPFINHPEQLVVTTDSLFCGRPAVKSSQIDDNSHSSNAGRDSNRNWISDLYLTPTDGLSWGAKGREYKCSVALTGNGITYFRKQ